AAIATPSAIASIAMADATAKRRIRSTSSGKQLAPTTAVGSATRLAIARAVLLIAILHRFERGRRRRHDRITQPAVETGQRTGQLTERLADQPIEDGVEKTAFERDQKQCAPDARRRQPLEGAARGRPIADRAFHPVEIVEDIRRGQELQQSKTGVA